MNEQNTLQTLRFRYRNILVNKNILPLSLLLKSNSIFEYKVIKGINYDKLVTILQKWFDCIELIEIIEITDEISPVLDDRNTEGQI